MKKLIIAILFLLPILCFGQTIKQKQVDGLINRLDSIHLMTGGGSSTIEGDSLNVFAYEFFDSLQARINTGLTFPPADYGSFYYEWWGVMRAGNGGGGGMYVISIGEGGAHPLLAGYMAVTDTSAMLTGNVYTGTGTLDDYTFNGSSPFLLDRLHHFAVAGNSTKIVWYVDGVPNGYKDGTFTRHTVGGATYTFCIGGSDHNNADMILLKMRGTEDYCPIDLSKWFNPYRFWYSNLPNEILHYDFTNPSRAKENLGNGFLGIKGYAIPQAGSFLSTPFGRYVGDSLIDFNAALPKFVKYPFSKPVYTGPTSSIPGSAVAYDDFNRADYVPAWPGNNPGGLYRTEGGTAGQTTYTISSGVGGVQLGQAWAERTGGGDTYVTTDVGTATQDVRVTHTTGLNAISAIARWTDANNFIQIYTSTAGVQSAGKMVAGVYTQFVSTWSAGAFSEIKLIVSGSLCNVWVDGVHRVTDADVSDITTGTKAGFGINSDYSRVAKFEVY